MSRDVHKTDVKTYSLKCRGWYRVIRGIIGFLVRLLSRLRVEGLENLPPGGPYLLVTNHLHWLDAPVIMVAFPHRSYVFAGEKWGEHWLLKYIFLAVDAIFVRRGEVDRKALRQALAVLNGGGVLGLAPEGTRSKTGGLQRGRTGAAYLAIRSGVPVVPMTITGQEKLFPALKRLRRAQVHVQFAPPMAAPPGGRGSGPESAQLHAFTQEIMLRLASLLPPEYRGVYAPAAEQRAGPAGGAAGAAQPPTEEDSPNEPSPQ